MRNGAIIFLSASLLFGAGTGSALAAHLPDFTPTVPIEHVTAAKLNPPAKPPYAMNYADEVAESFGVVNGRADFFDTGHNDSSYMPSLKGGVDRDGLMVKLQWHPGE